MPESAAITVQWNVFLVGLWENLLTELVGFDQGRRSLVLERADKGGR